jgi:hypothetical protein
MTTTLTDVRELEQVPDGTQISVATPPGIHPSTPRVWTMRDGRMHLDGAALMTDHFRSAINDGLVSIEAGLAVGQVYRSGNAHTSWYVLTPGDQEGRFHVLVVHRRGFHGLSKDLRAIPESGILVDPNGRNEEWTRTDDLAISMGRAMLEAEGNARPDPEAQAQAQRMGQRIETINDALIEMHGEMEDSDDQRRLRDLLTEYEMRNVNRDIELRIRVEGTTEVYAGDLSSSSLRQLAEVDGLDSIEGEGTVTINWSHEFNMTETYEGSEDDPCEDHDFVNNDMVSGWLDDMGVSYEDFTIEGRNCDCC